jgi:ferredoxin-type protein NapH
MENEKKSRLSSLKLPIIIMGLFWVIAIFFWQITGKVFYIFNFGYIGTAVSAGMATYSLLPKKKKYQGRRLSQLLVGIYMLGFLGFIGFENMQIEGFFIYILSGIFAGAVIHYLVAKIAGPFFFNRAWCSWACWTAMVLDFLPYRRNKQGRLPKYGYIRYAHFALSLLLITVLWFGLNYRVQPANIVELYWLIGGNLLYYAVGIILAFALKDNRAFCKYVCPITTFLKATSRFSMLKISGDVSKCTNCGACEKVCPMDIRITGYIRNGQRVLSTECIFCLECENVCPKGALESSWGFDCGRHELLTMSKNVADDWGQEADGN